MTWNLFYTSLRCLGQLWKNRVWDVSACFKPRETIYSHISAALADSYDKFVKNDLFGLEHDYQTHIIQNTMFRFVCVRRTDMTQRAFHSPDLGQCSEFPHHPRWVPRKFFTGLQRSKSQFFQLGWAKSKNFGWKKWILVVQVTWFFFF